MHKQSIGRKAERAFAEITSRPQVQALFLGLLSGRTPSSVDRSEPIPTVCGVFTVDLFQTSGDKRRTRGCGEGLLIGIHADKSKKTQRHAGNYKKQRSRTHNAGDLPVASSSNVLPFTFLMITVRLPLGEP